MVNVFCCFDFNQFETHANKSFICLESDFFGQLCQGCSEKLCVLFTLISKQVLNSKIMVFYQAKCDPPPSEGLTPTGTLSKL